MISLPNGHTQIAISRSPAPLASPLTLLSTAPGPELAPALRLPSPYYVASCPVYVLLCCVLSWPQRGSSSVDRPLPRGWPLLSLPSSPAPGPWPLMTVEFVVSTLRLSAPKSIRVDSSRVDSSRVESRRVEFDSSRFESVEFPLGARPLAGRHRRCQRHLLRCHPHQWPISSGSHIETAADAEPRCTA